MKGYFLCINIYIYNTEYIIYQIYLFLIILRHLTVYETLFHVYSMVLLNLSFLFKL